MGNVGAESAPDDAVPSRQVHLVKLCLDDLCNIIEDSSLLECEGDAVDCMLLHVLVHVSVLDDSVLRLLLVGAAVRLHHLRVSLTLPFLCFGSSGVSCNLCYVLSHL